MTSEMEYEEFHFMDVSDAVIVQFGDSPSLVKGVNFLKKAISKNFKIARGNLQLISHPRKSVSGTTVILGSKYPKLHYALIYITADTEVLG